MHLSQLEYFRAVAKEEHISRAAEKLHIAQPALSTTINRLEKELGVLLFERQGRNIVLNNAGKRLLDHAEYISSQFEELNKNLQETEDFLAHRLTIAVSNSMFMNGWLKKFVSHHHKIHLKQRMLSEKDMLAALMDESIDVAVGEFSETPSDITKKQLVEDEYIVLVPLTHPLAVRNVLYFNDICNESFISLPSNTIQRITHNLFAQKEMTPQIIFEGHQRMLTKMLRQGRGLLFASKQMIYMKTDHVQPFKTPKDYYAIHMLPIADLDTSCNLHICWKTDRTLPAMAEKFIYELDKNYPKYTDDVSFLTQKTIRISQ